MATVLITHPPSIPAAVLTLLPLFPGIISQINYCIQVLVSEVTSGGIQPNSFSFLLHFGPYATCLQSVELLILEVLLDDHLLCDTIFIHHTLPSNARASFLQDPWPFTQTSLMMCITWHCNYVLVCLSLPTRNYEEL